MSGLRRRAPASAADLRQRLYAGEVFLLPPKPASLDLAAAARALLVDAFPEVADPRDALAAVGDAEHFRRLGAVRRVLFCDPAFHERVFAVAAAMGFDPGRVAFDPPRLRVVAHRGDENPRARAVYAPHRDTWYAHSQAAVAWWIPLHAAAAEETFVFYPDRFRRPVANDSARFSYRRWVEGGWDLKIGWQRRDAGLEAHYPASIDRPEAGPALGFAAGAAGENLLFSAAHFHQTLPHRAGRTRFSLDFRLVDLDDHEAGRGAPNVDNESRGSAVIDYVRRGGGDP